MAYLTNTDDMSHKELCDRVYALEQALVPFAFIGRVFMDELGLGDEYDDARKLLRIDTPASHPSWRHKDD